MNLSCTFQSGVDRQRQEARKLDSVTVRKTDAFSTKAQETRKKWLLTPSSSGNNVFKLWQIDGNSAPLKQEGYSSGLPPVLGRGQSNSCVMIYQHSQRLLQIIYVMTAWLINLPAQFELSKFWHTKDNTTTINQEFICGWLLNSAFPMLWSPEKGWCRNIHCYRTLLYRNRRIRESQATAPRGEQ